MRLKRVGRACGLCRRPWAEVCNFNFEVVVDLAAGYGRNSKKLIEHAGLGEGPCVIVGSDDWFEIWNAVRWAAYEKEMDAEVSDVAENLSEDERGG